MECGTAPRRWMPWVTRTVRCVRKRLSRNSRYDFIGITIFKCLIEFFIQLQDNPVEMVFKKYIQTTFKAFFFTDSTESPTKEISTMSNDEKLVEATETQTPTTIKQHKSTLTGLSKYGPWGYLFLGMLLCGGALLVCGLWGKFYFASWTMFHHHWLTIIFQNAAAGHKSQTRPRYQVKRIPPFFSNLEWAIPTWTPRLGLLNRYLRTRISIHLQHIRFFSQTKNHRIIYLRWLKRQAWVSRVPMTAANQCNPVAVQQALAQSTFRPKPVNE